MEHGIYSNKQKPSEAGIKSKTNNNRSKIVLNQGKNNLNYNSSNEEALSYGSQDDQHYGGSSDSED